MTDTLHKEEFERSTLEPSKFKAEDIQLLANFLAHDPSGDGLSQPALISPDGKKQVIPYPIYETLKTIVESLNANKGVSIIPTNTKLTTQQAADFLQISRPTLIKLLDKESIPYELVGRHRRILLSDILAYENKLRRSRREQLRTQTAEYSEDGSYFDMPDTFENLRGK